MFESEHPVNRRGTIAIPKNCNLEAKDKDERKSNDEVDDGYDSEEEKLEKGRVALSYVQNMLKKNTGGRRTSIDLDAMPKIEDFNAGDDSIEYKTPSEYKSFPTMKKVPWYEENDTTACDHVPLLMDYLKAHRIVEEFGLVACKMACSFELHEVNEWEINHVMIFFGKLELDVDIADRYRRVFRNVDGCGMALLQMYGFEVSF
tara:strand:+ start:207 stop:815 length:609 start_codon:yes stop_codon:yes gene_type:complete